MNWDPTWERVFRTREWGRYPPLELVRFVARGFFSAPDRKEVRILELGCGMGANLWFLCREGFSVYGIDGSETALAKADERLSKENLKADLKVGDIISLREFYPDVQFDAVIDVVCLACNRTGEVDAILDQALAVLKPGGRFFSMTFASGTWGDGLGREIEPGTFVDIPEGPLQGVGVCHLFSLEEIEKLFGRFNNVRIESSIHTLNNRENDVRHWIVEGTKS